MQSIPFPQFIDAIYAVYSGPRYADSTLGRMLQVLGGLHDLGVATTADLTTATMVRYALSLSDSGLSANTINGYLSALGAACTFAIEERWLDRQPVWRRVRLPETPMVKNLPPPYQDARRLLDHLLGLGNWEGRRLCTLTWFFLLSGVRFREAILSWVADLNLEAPEFRVNPLRNRRKRLKTRASDRVVPLPTALAPILERWLPDAGPTWLFPGSRRRGPWVGGTTGTSKALDHLKREAAAVGISRITFHSLRHAYGTYAVGEWGAQVWQVQQVMGHTDIRTTQRYLHLKGSPRVAEAVRDFGFGLAP